MTIALIIALLVGGGTSYVAEGTLPGDKLYVVKVNVNEPVSSLIFFNQNDKAERAAKFAVRRLEEAEELIQLGRFNETTRAEVISRFDGQSNNFANFLTRVESKSHPGLAIETQSDFEASLRAHAVVLEGLSDRSDASANLIKPLLDNINTRIETVVLSLRTAQADVVGPDQGHFVSAADSKKTTAQHKIAEVRSFMSNGNFSVQSQAAAEAILRQAEELIKKGQTELDALLYGQAFASFQEASRLAQQAKLTVETEQKFKLDIRLPSESIPALNPK